MMSAATRTCPYCNSLVPPPAAGAARVICPRCGESLAARPVLPEDAVAADPLPSGVPSAPRLLEPPRGGRLPLAVAGLSVLTILGSALVLLTGWEQSQRTFPLMVGVGVLGLIASGWLWYFQRPRTNGATAGFILGNMAAVALVVLVFALAMQPFRRGLDPPRKKPPADTPGTVPADLAALAYLPADSNLVAATHVAELLRSPSGKTFLGEGSWAPVEAALRQAERWTGLKRDDIDHLALGMGGDGLPLRVSIAVRTRAPYDPRALRPGPDPIKPMEHAGRLLYPLQLKPVGEGALWCVEERTLLLQLWWDGTAFPKVKESLPLKGRTAGEAVPTAIRGAVERDLPRGTPVWVAGRGVSAGLLGNVLPFARAVQGETSPLGRATGFAAGLRFRDDTATLFGELDGPDVKAAREMVYFLESRTVPGVGAPRVAGPGAGRRERLALAAGGVGAAAREPLAVPTFWIAGGPVAGEPGAPAGSRVSFQVSAAPETLRQALAAKGKLFP